MSVRQDYSYSLDKNGMLVHVHNAQKGNEYFCPCCGAIMIPKQGVKKRWHFAHKGNLGHCSYETYLHKLAKLRIRECFNTSPKFTISFHSTSTCNVSNCPLGTTVPCTWNPLKSFDLKEYYDKCEEEVSIDNFRADLIITNTKRNREPILIEIYVSHKSTEEKLRSGYRIIEVHIESEEDINQIISSSQIKESEGCLDRLEQKSNDKIIFYNFKADKAEMPANQYQAEKFLFWIDPRNNYFNFDRIKCLNPNSTEVENATFRIESSEQIGWDFAFQKLSQAGLGIKYCTMCRFYRMNDFYLRSICILYKSKKTPKIPRLLNAMKCPYFKQIDYGNEERIFGINEDQPCKITFKQ